jgi:uncharacterized protein (TIGR02301 family)
VSRRLAADTMDSIGKRMRVRTLAAVLLLALAAPAAALPALAVDPPYEPQMERLAEVMGSLYFLDPLCKPGSPDWRAQVAELIKLDQPDQDREERLNGAFNAGYTAYSRLYRTCTDSAQAALARLLTEAEATARDIHARYAE